MEIQAERFNQASSHISYVQSAASDFTAKTSTYQNCRKYMHFGVAVSLTGLMLHVVTGSKRISVLVSMGGYGCYTFYFCREAQAFEAIRDVAGWVRFKEALTSRNTSGSGDSSTQFDSLVNSLKTDLPANSDLFAMVRPYLSQARGLVKWDQYYPQLREKMSVGWLMGKPTQPTQSAPSWLVGQIQGGNPGQSEFREDLAGCIKQFANQVSTNAGNNFCARLMLEAEKIQSCTARLKGQFDSNAYSQLLASKWLVAQMFAFAEGEINTIREGSIVMTEPLPNTQTQPSDLSKPDDKAIFEATSIEVLIAAGKKKEEQ